MVGNRSNLSNLVAYFTTCLACVYIAGRLWSTAHENSYLREELEKAYENRRSLGYFHQNTPATAKADGEPSRENSRILFYNTRPKRVNVPPLTGPLLSADPLPVQFADSKLLGQVDNIESAVVSGWACVRGTEAPPLKVVVYIDGVFVGDTLANSADTHDGVRRLCQLDMQLGNTGAPPRGVGFSLQLPLLPEGEHQLRAFAIKPEGNYKQELNQSPVSFLEVTKVDSTQQQLKRKDEIIRTRNSQIAALWEELNTQQPWRNVLDKPSKISFEAPAENTTRKLAFIGINTAIGTRVRRDILRRTWVPTGEALKAYEQQTGLVVRFVVGYSEQKNDADEGALQQEMKQYGDIIRINLVDSYDELSKKTLRMFTDVTNMVDADFYFKIDDDVAVNLDELAVYLEKLRHRPNLYFGCMKSGPVLTDPHMKWYEPESWRFGDPTTEAGSINYMRHASGQLYGLSRQVTRYIAKNSAVLHRYANEDVTVGTWLVGLDIEYIHEKRLCCDTEAECRAQKDSSNTCLGYFEMACAGICRSEERLEQIYNACLKDPLGKKKPAAS